MPPISEMVRLNEAYQEANPGVQPVLPAPAQERPPLVTFQPPANLPVRGAFPSLTISGSDFYLSQQQFRIGTVRSPMPVVPVQPAQINGKVGPLKRLFNTSLTSPTIGNGSPLNRYNRVVGSITAAQVAANTTVTQSFTVAGVRATDNVIGYQWGSAQKKGVVVIAVRVTGNNTIAIDFSNPTAGALTPTAGQLILFLVQ